MSLQEITGEQQFTGDGTKTVFTIDFSASPLPSDEYMPLIAPVAQGPLPSWQVQRNNANKIDILFYAPVPQFQVFTFYWRLLFGAA